jgi:hypothetical protein
LNLRERYAAMCNLQHLRPLPLLTPGNLAPA